MRTPKEHEIKALLDIIYFDLDTSGKVCDGYMDRAIVAESAIEMAKKHLDKLSALYGLEHRVSRSTETSNDFRGHPGTII